MRTATNVGLVVVFFLILALAGCAEPSPLEPVSYVPAEQCMTPFGQYYDCDGPVPAHPACLDSIPPCSIIPMIPKD